MSHDIHSIFKKWDAYQDAHTRVLLPQRKEAILELLDQLTEELKQDATFSVDDQDSAFTIRITADAFVASDDSPTLKELIRQANVFRANIVDEQIVFDLWYMCWQWVEK